MLQYFGGTNFGRTSGGPFYVTSYDYDAPLDEFGMFIYDQANNLYGCLLVLRPVIVLISSKLTHLIP